MVLKSEMIVSVSSMGRFGTSITSVTDLNGDGLRDTAVGAPLEDENRGAVYIFLGDSQKGIRSTFSQVAQPYDTPLALGCLLLMMLHKMREVTLQTFVSLSFVSTNSSSKQVLHMAGVKFHLKDQIT